jgi:lipoprotein-releasing system ATP-binding protein
MIYQFHHLLPEFTALENVMISAIIAGESTARAAKRARQLLERVHLAHRAEHYPSQLSGGEQQRVAIARSLMNNPILLYADEPTGNLDSANATDIANLFFELQSEQGLACVIATHSVELAARCDRTLYMHDGVLIGSVA